MRPKIFCEVFEFGWGVRLENGGQGEIGPTGAQQKAHSGQNTVGQHKKKGLTLRSVLDRLMDLAPDQTTMMKRECCTENHVITWDYFLSLPFFSYLPTCDQQECATWHRQGKKK